MRSDGRRFLCEFHTLTLAIGSFKYHLAFYFLAEDRRCCSSIKLQGSSSSLPQIVCDRPCLPDLEVVTNILLKLFQQFNHQACAIAEIQTFIFLSKMCLLAVLVELFGTPESSLRDLCVITGRNDSNTFCQVGRTNKTNLFTSFTRTGHYAYAYEALL